MITAILAAMAIVAGGDGGAFAPARTPEVTVPAAVVEGARQMLAERLGADAAATLRLVDGAPIVTVRSGFPAQGEDREIVGWEMVVRFHPWPRQSTECELTIDYTDISGYLFTQAAGPSAEYSVPALPDCAGSRVLCEPSIDQAAAIAIAKAIGPAADGNGYSAAIGFTDDGAAFTWRVKWRPEGASHDRVLVVDAGTGRVLADYEDRPCSP